MNSSFRGRVGGLRPSSGDGPSWLGSASVIGLTSNENGAARFDSALLKRTMEKLHPGSALCYGYFACIFSVGCFQSCTLLLVSPISPTPPWTIADKDYRVWLGLFLLQRGFQRDYTARNQSWWVIFFQSVVLDVYQLLRFWFFLNIFFFLSYNKLIFHELGTCSLCEPLTERSKQCFHLHEKFVDSMNFKIQMAQPRPHRAFCNEVVSIWVKQPYYGTDFECGYI